MIYNKNISCTIFFFTHKQFAGSIALKLGFIIYSLSTQGTGYWKVITQERIVTGTLTPFFIFFSSIFTYHSPLIKENLLKNK